MAITVSSPVAPIGPCSLKHLPCYISFWISHGGSLKNRASEERKRGDGWGQVRQRSSEPLADVPFHSRKKKERRLARYLSAGIRSWAFARSLKDVFRNSRRADSRRWRTPRLRKSPVLRSRRDQPVTNICPISLKPWWANGAGRQVDVTRMDLSMERADPAGERRPEYLILSCPAHSPPEASFMSAEVWEHQRGVDLHGSPNRRRGTVPVNWAGDRCNC